MIKAIIAHDNSDAELGEFFSLCFECTKSILTENKKYHITELCSNRLNDLSIECLTSSFNTARFLFVSFTHGDNSSLVVNGGSKFVSTSLNNDKFKNAYMYCLACHAGDLLGKKICDNGAIFFIGYKDVFSFNSIAKDDFVTTSVHVIELLCAGNSAEKSVLKTKLEFDKYIDKWYNTNMLTAMTFMDNRDALTIHGNKNECINFATHAS